MNRLEKFRAKSAQVVLPGETEPTQVSSLTFPEMAEFAQYLEKSDMKSALNYMLFVTLRKIVPKDGPDAMTDEQIRSEINQMDSMTAMKIVEAVREASGLSTPEDKKKDTVTL